MLMKPLPGIISQSAADSLLTDLVAWWSLDEESGTRYDAHTSGINLTDVNTTGYISGKQGNAADFVHSNSERLEVTDGNTLAISNSDFTIVGWVKIDTTNNDPDVNWYIFHASEGDGVSPFEVAEFVVRYENHATSLQIAGSFYDDVNAAWITPVSADTAIHDTWVWCLFEWDSASLEARCSMNNGTPGTASASAGAAMTVTLDSVAINSISYGSSATRDNNTNDMAVDELAVWSRLLTADEKSRLYASGAGLSYADISTQYLFKATFSQANQSYSNGQTITTAQGVEHGSLYLAEVDGTLQLSSNKYDYTTQTTPTWGDQGFYTPNPITRRLGLPFFVTFNPDTVTTSERGYIGWALSAAVHSGINGGDTLGVSGDSLNAYDSLAGGAVEMVPLSIGSDRKAGVILGGYNSSGVPYTAGDTKANFTYGASFFFKDDDGMWKLGHVDFGGNQSSMYLAFSNHSHSGQLDNMQVVNADLSSALEYYTYDATIATNDTFTHSADGIIRVYVTTVPNAGHDLLVRFREQDSSNYWRLVCSSNGSVCSAKVEEVVSGTPTIRLALTSAILSSGEYIEIILDDEDIRVTCNNIVVDSTVRVYQSAANFKTETTGRVIFPSGAIGNVITYVRGTNNEFSVLADYEL
jgi:hypothetical protein